MFNLLYIVFNKLYIAYIVSRLELSLPFKRFFKIFMVHVEKDDPPPLRLLKAVIYQAIQDSLKPEFIIRKNRYGLPPDKLLNTKRRDARNWLLYDNGVINDYCDYCDRDRGMLRKYLNEIFRQYDQGNINILKEIMYDE